MGCTLNRKSDQTPEELLISQTISSFSFGIYSSINLVNNFYPAVVFHQVSFKVIKKVIPSLKFTESSKDFLKDLTQKHPCSSKKFKTLLALLSNSTALDKVLYIFDIFAEDNLETLLVWEAELMISQILQITLQYIPEYVLKINKNCLIYEDFKNYCIKLSLFNNFLLKIFTKKLFQGKKEIGKQEFVYRVISSKKLVMLVNGENLRTYCIDFFIENLIVLKDELVT